MTKEIWINLPVRDVAKAKEFFNKLGFGDTKQGNSKDSAGVTIGSKNVVVMLFSEALFEGFSRNKITDTKQGTEVLFSIDAESREEVDELAKKAADAGGNVFAQPGESHGWMYGCGFEDLDGHRWNVLHMDMSKIPKM